MKAGEESTQAKTSKSATSVSEAPTVPSYPDWTNSMQAYYGAGAAPPPYFASAVGSPTPHPYMWGGQHALMPPYGTPVPYPAMYPPGGLYAHPNMAMQVPNTVPTNADFDGKASNGKNKPSARKAKGSLLGKVMENEKAASGSGNNGVTQSDESGSEGSSEASDENSNQQECAATKNGQFEQMLAEANGQNNTSSSAASAKLRPSGASSTIVPAAMPERWIQQDEREVKKQKRKQSNRESARRSRLRKQAECEDLQTRVQNLSNENRDLRDELQRLSENCEKLKSENDSIKEELTRIHGPDAIATLELGNPPLALQWHNAEGNS